EAGDHRSRHVWGRRQRQKGIRDRSGCSADAERRVNENRGCQQTVARLESIPVLPGEDKGPVSVTKIIDGAELLIPMAGHINK
ncbi:hypothetical protein, partial [Escherichia coli]|uniref:hypothetical protein n=1 Tax=Escherichia coli TaxID=562 RepID=UPI0018E1E65F